MIILKNSGFAFGPHGSWWTLPTPNEVIFGLLGPQAPRMHPQMGWGPPTTHTIGTKGVPGRPGPWHFFHFFAKKLENGTLDFAFPAPALRAGARQT